MGNKFKLRHTDITVRIATHYKRFTGRQPAELAKDHDALTAKVTCEGGIYVGLRLIDEAVQAKNDSLADALVASMIAARDQLNSFDFEKVRDGRNFVPAEEMSNDNG